ncbi:glycosyltransferase family 4 protein [Cellulomonas sp. URHD0024]|uniref:glycosyltransferase family 4 protein n=1 Tax=Cellulomonas sp. URHD0024 TaxID=1302620 RepID=UPI0012DE4277|nr:glycosyltransferase [Cellulomonas sp. URHD0024]
MSSVDPVRLPVPGTIPSQVQRLVVHQIDISHPVPGGIDGVIRGILRFGPVDEVTAVAGVIARAGPGRAVGRWECYDLDGRTVWFLPVAELDASNQRRVLPHSIRLVAGLARHRRSLPRAESLHVHRADTAWSAHTLLRHVPMTYFVHTQENGLTSGATDSFWRRAPRVHAAMERSAVRASRDVVVFNPEYAERLGATEPNVVFSPNWYEPDLVRWTNEPDDPDRVVWVGRLEPPKDPLLAVDVLEALVALDPDRAWRLVVLGSGTLADQLSQRRAALPEAVRSRVELSGAVSPTEVGRVLSSSGVFLMTSVPGYEGHPRVLVEALASGLPAVVTTGSDTGDLVAADENGYVVSRDPGELARAVLQASALSRETARRSVETLSAPVIVQRILRGSGVDVT